MAKNVGSVFEVKWSPDKYRCAFDTTTKELSRIFVVNADGSHRRVISAGTPFEAPGLPAWSPDSTRIAFVKTPGKANRYGLEYWVVAADGSALTPLYRSGCCPGCEPTAPVWSPDGTQVAYNAPHGWQLKNADGSGRATSISPATVEGWQQRSRY